MLVGCLFSVGGLLSLVLWVGVCAWFCAGFGYCCRVGVYVASSIVHGLVAGVCWLWVVVFWFTLST